MPKLSVVIITLNEERNLERCLRSIAGLADEVVVVDSGSTDRTKDICSAYGARFIVQPFLGYVAQKNFATEQATHDWVLNLDADEEVSADLQDSIRNVLKAPEAAAYKLGRMTNYCGYWIRHSGWYPDIKIRLYDRRTGRWQGEQIHEYWEPASTETRIGEVRGILYHYSYYTISDHLRQIEKFSEILARRAVNAGKTASILKILAAPGWKFFTDFIIRLGFLDGYHGYLVCRLSATATFAKYSKIRQYAKMKKEGKPF